MTKEQRQAYMKQYRKDHAERIKLQQSEYNKTHKEQRASKGKEYRDLHKDNINRKRRENRHKTRENAKIYVLNRIKNDPLYKLKHLLRCRIQKAFKAIANNKTDKTHDLLGANYLTIKAHIEKQFIEGMSWENHGQWHIDHIIPLGSTKNPEKLKSLCHYTNLQPLWAKDNLAKRNIINYYAA